MIDENDPSRVLWQALYQHKNSARERRDRVHAIEVRLAALWGVARVDLTATEDGRILVLTAQDRH